MREIRKQTESEPITIVGIGCTLYADQGFGVRIIQSLGRRFEFPGHVQLVDGGLAGVALQGIMAASAHLIAVDILTNDGPPGKIYRLEGKAILERLKRRDNYIQQLEFLEALAHCQVLDHPPHAVLIGVEPHDASSLACEVSPILNNCSDAVTARICCELTKLGVTCHPRTADDSRADRQA